MTGADAQFGGVPRSSGFPASAREWVVELRRTLGHSISDAMATEMFESLPNGAALEFVLHPIRCSLTIGERPRVSLLARYETASGFVTTASHRNIRLENGFERFLPQLLDGTRTVSEWTSLLRERFTPTKPISGAQWEELVWDNLMTIASHGSLS